MEEEQTIVKKKAEYQRWYDSIKNHNTNSPIFKKVIFITQRSIFCLKKYQKGITKSYLVGIQQLQNYCKFLWFLTTIRSIARRLKAVISPSCDFIYRQLSFFLITQKFESLETYFLGLPLKLDNNAWLILWFWQLVVFTVFNSSCQCFLS